MTETADEEEFIVSAETTSSNERIAEKKVIVYETRIDPTVIRVAGEKFKRRLFARFGFLKPRAEEVEFVSMEKYYEPYSMISGKYFVDYYRKCTHLVEVDKKVLEVVLLNNTFEPEASTDSSAKDKKTIRLEGEERLRNEVKGSLILDRYGQEVNVEKLPSAPSERQPRRVLAESGVQEIAGSDDLDIIRSRIFKRPEDINRIVSELFEVQERAVIYTPRFRVMYRNSKTGQEKLVEFDGVTAEKIQPNNLTNLKDVSVAPPPPPPPPQ